MPPKRGKIRPSISSDPAPSPKRASLIATPAAPAAVAAPPRDWKAEPDLRAFACLLSWDAGWSSEPGEIVWSFDDDTKVVEVKRPTGSESRYESMRCKWDGAMKADAAIAEIRRRWGVIVAGKAEAFAFPDRARSSAQELLGGRARYLRGIAMQLAGASQPNIEAALVDVVRTCVAIARGANLGDPSASAAATRAIAAGALLELINPAPV